MQQGNEQMMPPRHPALQSADQVSQLAQENDGLRQELSAHKDVIGQQQQAMAGQQQELAAHKEVIGQQQQAMAEQQRGMADNGPSQSQKVAANLLEAVGTGQASLDELGQTGVLEEVLKGMQEEGIPQEAIAQYIDALKQAAAQAQQQQQPAPQAQNPYSGQ